MSVRRSKTDRWQVGLSTTNIEQDKTYDNNNKVEDLCMCLLNQGTEKADEERHLLRTIPVSTLKTRDKRRLWLKKKSTPSNNDEYRPTLHSYEDLGYQVGRLFLRYRTSDEEDCC
ncbi:MAG: hypothetical protein GY820_02500 [Gammaproteobacteria bacterium]|nr:hypothetical protein [Gammaproteobacteria bacterium]